LKKDNETNNEQQNQEIEKNPEINEI